MTTYQATKIKKSAITDNQVTELQTSINNINAIVGVLSLDPWQNLNAAITGVVSLVDNNDTSSLDNGDTVPNDEINADIEINNLVTDNNETPLLNTASDPTPSVSADFNLLENDANPLEDPADSAVDSTTNADNSGKVIDNTADATIEPTVKPDEFNVVDNISNETQIDESLIDAVITDEMTNTPSAVEDQVNSPADATTNTDNSSEVIDNPDVVADTGNEIQIDNPLTNAVDVSDELIIGGLIIREGLVTRNNLNEMTDPFRMDRFPTINTHLTSSTTDNLIWFTFTTINIDIVNFVTPSSNKIEVIAGRDINLNSNFIVSGDSVTTDEAQPTLFSGDNTTAPNDDVFSNSDISILGTLTPNGDDNPLTDSADVADDSIVGDLVMTNESFGMDSGTLDESIKNNTDLLTDSIVGNLTEVASTIADTDTVDLAEFSSNEVEATSGGEVDLNSNFIVSGDSATTDETQPAPFFADNVTAPNDDVFSNSDMSMLGTLTSTRGSDAPLADTVDVTDDSIVEDLVTPESLDITNEPLGSDNGSIDGLFINNTDLLTDSIIDNWAEDPFMLAYMNFIKLVRFSSNETQTAFERNNILNFAESPDSIFIDTRCSSF